MDPILPDASDEPAASEPPRVTERGDRLHLEDTIEFVVDTNTLQPYSIPTLRAVADHLNQRWAIANVVIEGHASQEGTVDHNYELAESRARAIWEKLLEFGVAAERVSYRGMGEVAPLRAGDTEESLQSNRRVEFHIVRQYESPDEMPEYPAFQTLPWSGEVVPVVTPPTPPPLERPEEGDTGEGGLWTPADE